MLFILAVDALQSFVNNAAPLLAGQIIIPPRALQYADDTAILLEAIPRNLTILKYILENFAMLSGLHINNSKCLFVPVAIPSGSLPGIAQVLQCEPKEMPVTYLGLPLTIRKPKKIHFKPLLDAFQRKLDGWQTKFLSLGRRLTLVKTVLTALPLHYMQAIRLPKLLIKHLDGIRRRFFWKGREKCLRGHCLVNWAKCCLPKKCGGLGIINLSIQNQALLMKWLWKLQHQPDSTWAASIQLLYGTTDLVVLSCDTRVFLAFKEILSFKDFYNASLLSVLDTQQSVWKWTSSGIYSSASAYSILADPGVRSSYYTLLWNLKIPPKVKIFLWVLLLDRVLTQQNLLVRNWPSIPACKCCDHGTFETSSHLFVLCNYARRVWTLIQIRFSLPLLILAPDLEELWLQNRASVGHSWDIIWAAVTWAILKERNRRIFSNKSLPPNLLMAEICAAISAWLSSA
ncbi:hypothetical protein LUZ61_002961 [Rhynchospora tenuis]|uniref:Reverse transcriptase domain-containing protein n=1 Tax=Rhynchospora tenuis TaxID=198213 RepID=A0AAD5ZJV4_9POAL|nr:hypothetical protein LUZ61_002961 [Rhynchospora tenuis]